MTLPTNTANATESTIRIPFDSAKNAEIAFKVLNVDKEPRRNFVKKELHLEKDVLVACFQADQVKSLRTAITSFFEALLLCQETIKQFEIAPTEESKLGNHGGTQSSTDAS